MSLKAKKRDRSPDKEWSDDKKKEDSACESELHQQSASQSQFQATRQPLSSEQQKQPFFQETSLQTLPTKSSNGYSIPEQHNVVGSPKLRSKMPTYNMYAAMIPQSFSNQSENMGTPPNSMQADASLPSNIEMTLSSSAGINPNTAYMPMSGDMFSMMAGMKNFCPYPVFPQESMMITPVKKIITLSSCVLYPPHPGEHIKCRERNPGCKTVFVGGLPEMITEEIIREIFSRYGEISTVRMSKKNFCHVRFAAESYVDPALMISGYRLKIENKDESAYSGRLHVDYAKARDDEYEYECMQRALQREARHRERLELEASRPPTPPPVVHYSEHEANLLSDKLKSEEHFKSATHVLITWLERGECNKKTCRNFYSMIQCTNSQIKRLLNEKVKLEEELTKGKTEMQKKMTLISLCLNDIHNVCDTISKSQIIRNSFTKSQKKNIEVMREEVVYIIQTHTKQLVEERVEEKMDLSFDEGDLENGTTNPLESSIEVGEEELQKLKQEVEEARKQYQTAVETNTVLRNKMDSSVNVNAQILQEMQEKMVSKQSEIAELQKFKESYLANVGHESDTSEASPDFVQQIGKVKITQHETLLIVFIAIFIKIHQFGASIDDICSYLNRNNIKSSTMNVENLLNRFPNLFRESFSIGATLKKKWTFLGYP